MRRSTVVGIFLLSFFLDGAFGVAFAYAQHVSIWDGLYFATTTGSTVGYGDITPIGWLPHLLSVAIMILVIPLFTSVFSLLTTALTARHVDRRHEELKRHVSEVHSGGSCRYPGGDSQPGERKCPSCAFDLSGGSGHDQPADAPGHP